MSNITKKRCPYCKTINTIDIDEELKKHKQPVIRYTDIYRPEPPPPKMIFVRCTNPECKKKFKIRI